MTQLDTPLYDIIFRGDIMPGHQLPDVKKKLAQLFKADEQKINGLFAGGAVPLKKNLAEAAAQKYQAVLRQAGADVQIAAAGSVSARVPKKRPAAQVSPAPSSKPMSMQERLAQQQRQQEQGASENQHREPAPTAAEGASLETAFTLAPVGEDLLAGSKRPPESVVDIDVSQFSLRPQEGNLVDTDELSQEEAVVVQLTDYGLSELGDDLLHDDEREQIVAKDIQVLDVDLAPAGSELGQIKKASPPPPPDTSGIALE
jgi:hypothetical protein